jgi:replication initiation and membrane attachment protein DnaB
MTIHNSLNKLFEKYSIDEEGLVDYLKSKFSNEYKLAIKDLKDEGVENPASEITPGRIADHIKNEKIFLDEVEKFGKDNSF